MSVDASIDHVVGILIVDRDDEVSAAWSGSLVASGYRLAWVDSAGQALVELARQRPDLLICNADLPDLAIDALCMAIRSSPDIRDVPVLAISQAMDALRPDRLLNSGVQSVLFKPFDSAQLQARVVHLLTAQCWDADVATTSLSGRLADPYSDVDTNPKRLRELLQSTLAHAAEVESVLRQRKRELSSSNAVLATLYRLAQSLNRATTESQVVGVALDCALDLPGVNAGWIQILDSGKSFRLAASRNLPPGLMEPDAFAGLCECKRRVLDAGRDRTAAVIDCERLAKATGDTHGLRYHASIPLWIGDDVVLGVMNLAGPGQGAIDARELEALYNVGNQVAVALERVRLLGDLEQLVHDRTALLEREIEERRQVEILHERLAAIIEATPDLVATSRIDGTPMYCNPAGRRMLGLMSAGTEEGEFSLLNRLPVFQDDGAVAHAIAHGTWKGEAILRRSDGSKFPVSQVIVAHKDEEGSVAYLSTNARDITEEQRNLDALNRMAGELRDANMALMDERGYLQERVAERTATLTAVNLELAQAKIAAEQSSRAKSAFLATMSHEIRTPMNGVLGMVDVLAESELSDYQRELVNTARDSGHALLGIISDILDFSKIEAEQLTLEFEPVSLYDLTEGVCNTLGTMAASKGVELELFIAPDTPEMILGDDVRLHQVLYNLLGNAIKFSSGNPDRAGNVALRVTMTDAHEHRIVFQCIDNGIGMSDATIGQLFTPFKQADTTTTRRFGGSGLGLPICKRLLDMMNGTIAVQSRLGEGSVFTVELPVEVATTQPPRDLPDLTGVACVIMDGPRIRTDDLWCYLEHAGASVTRVADSMQLLRLIESRPKAAQWVVLVADGAMDADAYEVLGKAGDVRYLSIGFGRRRQSRLLEANTVTIDGVGLRQKALLRAVAVAAGRASPEAFVDQREVRHGVGGELPTIALAREKGRLILVAEDDAVNQMVIQRQLNLLGYVAEIASNGAQALAMWKHGSYGMVLSDLHMPEMDGLALTRSIRDHEQGKRRVPIVILSANALRGEAMRARSHGVDDYLTKPAPLPQLKKLLEKWLPPLRAPAAPAPVPSPAHAVTVSVPAFDIDVLRQLVGSDEAILRELLHDYLDGALVQAGQLRTAVAQSDTGLVRAIAHKLKSSSRSIGAMRLAECCARLEVAGGSGDLMIEHQAIDNLEQAVQDMESEIVRWLKLHT